MYPAPHVTLYDRGVRVLVYESAQMEFAGHDARLKERLHTVA
jgi:hypothetical protein